MKRWVAVVLAVLLALGLVFRQQIATSAEVALLIAQVFPQVPVKPLGWVTRGPEHREVAFEGSDGRISADLWLPRPWIGKPATSSEPALIICQGVKIPAGSARSEFLDLGDALARLGFVVLFPRLQALGNGKISLERPATYVRSFSYLHHMRAVDGKRISYLGFSVGSSIALVAAAAPAIRARVHALIFFAGYYSLTDYVAGFANDEDLYQGRLVRWQPDPGAVRQVKHVVRSEGGNLIRVFHARSNRSALHVLRSAGPKVQARLKRLDPAAHIRSYHAATFILDDYGDTFVPYVESEKLDRALPPGQVKAFLITDVFHHVSPGQGGLLALLGAFGSVFGFFYSALNFL
ncbi:MAG: hypothetical protein ACRDFS_02610 [Chloroflexota bacterium]